MKRVFEKYLNSIGKYFPIQKLYAPQWFSREKIKWLLQIMKYELGVSKDQFQVLLELIFNLDLFEFYSNYFSPKIKYMEIRVTWFPTTENWRKINLKSFWYFFKWFLLNFNRPVALFDLSEFVWILFEVIKMFMS